MPYINTETLAKYQTRIDQHVKTEINEEKNFEASLQTNDEILLLIEELPKTIPCKQKVVDVKNSPDTLLTCGEQKGKNTILCRPCNLFVQMVQKNVEERDVYCEVENTETEDTSDRQKLIPFDVEDNAELVIGGFFSQAKAFVWAHPFKALGYGLLAIGGLVGIVIASRGGVNAGESQNNATRQTPNVDPFTTQIPQTNATSTHLVAPSTAAAITFAPSTASPSAPSTSLRFETSQRPYFASTSQVQDALKPMTSPQVTTGESPSSLPTLKATSIGGLNCTNEVYQFDNTLILSNRTLANLEIRLEKPGENLNGAVFHKYIQNEHNETQPLFGKKGAQKCHLSSERIVKNGIKVVGRANFPSVITGDILFNEANGAIKLTLKEEALIMVQTGSCEIEAGFEKECTGLTFEKGHAFDDVLETKKEGS